MSERTAYTRKGPVIDMRNMITINLDQNERCDCLASVDSNENSIEIEFLHISWSEPGIACMLPNGDYQQITDYTIDGSLNRSLHVTLPKEYWNTKGTLQVMVWDGTFSSSLIDFECINVADTDRMTVKIDGTGYALSVYVPEGQQVVNIIYPVGSIIENANASFNPNTAFPGTTWERIKGKVLVGVDENDTDFSTSGKTGGEKTHKLTVDEMPKHDHKYYSPIVQQVQATNNGTTYGNYNKGYTIGTTDTGGDAAHNNLQPYVTVYIWKRTA